MRELLYISHFNPPEQVLHHALLYRDSIAVIAPENVGDLLSLSSKCARDAGLLRSFQMEEVLVDDFVAAEAEKGMSRALQVELSRSPGAYCAGISAIVEDLKKAGFKMSGFDLLEDFKDKAIRNLVDDSVDVIVDGNPVLSEGIEWASGRLEKDRRKSDGAEVELFGVFAAWIVSVGFAVAERARLDSAGPLLIPCYADSMSGVVRDCRPEVDDAHLLATFDVGRLLPQPPPGVDTNVLINFRARYDDERRRLIRAVERLVKDSARVYGKDASVDIERDVREELGEALADLRAAGRSAFGGWVRRAAWFTFAAAASGTAGPAGAAAGSVAANWASNRVPKGMRGTDYTYLYRLQSALADFAPIDN